MLATGRALAMRPRLLMMDEPSLGLAPNLAQGIFATIRDINTQGVTVLLVEQNVKQALSLAHRAYVLENGPLILQGNASELAENTHVRKAYLGICPRASCWDNAFLSRRGVSGRSRRVNGQPRRPTPPPPERGADYLHVLPSSYPSGCPSQDPGRGKG